uniref:Fibrinogen-like protein 1 n=1 Tax=Apteryx owenii TaxID=8824 RepID=A0A8B9QEP0_APTOW
MVLSDNTPLSHCHKYVSVCTYVSLSSFFSHFLLEKKALMLGIFYKQIRLQAQVRLLEHRVKQKQLKIIQLLEKKEIQYSDRGDENRVIDLGGKRQYSDCAEIYNNGHKQSGFYKMKPVQSPNEFLAFCDMSEGGGWTVFQRRSDGSQNFDRVWADYEEGFGNFVLANGEYWLGNKNLYYLTMIQVKPHGNRPGLSPCLPELLQKNVLSLH